MNFKRLEQIAYIVNRAECPLLRVSRHMGAFSHREPRGSLSRNNDFKIRSLLYPYLQRSVVSFSVAALPFIILSTLHV